MRIMNNLMKQLNEIQDQTNEAKSVLVVSRQKVENTGHFEFPKIDPYNDPLAPVARHMDMEQKKINSEVYDTKKVYDYGQDGDIRLQ